MGNGIPQPWLMVYSKQGYEREMKTLEQNLEKRMAQVKKDTRHLRNEVFRCEKDVEWEIEKLAKKSPCIMCAPRCFRLSSTSARIDAGKNGKYSSGHGLMISEIPGKHLLLSLIYCPAAPDSER